MATWSPTPTAYYQVYSYDSSNDSTTSTSLLLSNSITGFVMRMPTTTIKPSEVTNVTITLRKNAVPSSTVTLNPTMGFSSSISYVAGTAMSAKSYAPNASVAWGVSTIPTSMNLANTWYICIRPSSMTGDTMCYSTFVSLVVTYTPTPTNCTAPSSVTVASNNVAPSTNVTLNWSGAVAGTVNAITGYDVYRSTTAGSGYALLTSVASTATSGSTTVTSHATPGSSYYYKVVTKGAAGATYNSGQSSATATLTTTVTACTAPSSVTVSSNNVRPSTNVTLNWSGAAGGTNNAIDGYDIYRSETAGSGYTLLTSVATSATSGSTTVTSHATKGSAYYYKVVTKGIRGATYYSGQSSATATLTTAPYGNTIGYYTGGAFAKCEVYWYVNGTGFVECVPYVMQGSAWVECNTG